MTLVEPDDALACEYFSRYSGMPRGVRHWEGLDPLPEPADQREFRVATGARHRRTATVNAAGTPVLAGAGPKFR